MRLRLTSLLALLALATALVATGCGGSSSTVSDTTAEVLSYYPSGAPYVIVANTDPNSKQAKNIGKLAGRFPGGPLLLGRLEDKLKSQAGISYEKDVKPVLGNDFAVGAPTVAAAGANHLVGAFVAKDEGKLSSLFDKLSKKNGAKQTGDEKGYKLYAAGSNTAIARKGPVLLIADTVADLKSAIGVHDGSDRLTTSKFDAALSGLSKDALVRIYGNAAALLARPSSAQARRVPWVAALKTFGVAASVEDSGVEVAFHLDTSGKPLSGDQLPLATGDAAPKLAGAGPVRFGLRDLGQALRFAQSAAQSANPASYARFARAKRVIARKIQVDLDRDIVDQLSGDAVLRTDLSRSYQLRAQVKDPRAFARSLKRLDPLVPSFLSGAGARGARVRSVGGGLYEVSRNGSTAAYGVVGNVFVAGTGTPAQLRAFGRAVPTAAQDAHGAFVVDVPKGELSSLITRRGGLPPAAGLFLGALGGAHGWAADSPQGLDGQFKVDIGG